VVGNGDDRAQMAELHRRIVASASQKSK